jgi:hypothetical protein
MATGSPCTSMVNLLMGSETTKMHACLDDGLHLEIRPVRMNTSTMYLVRTLTPQAPNWSVVCAGETPTLALKNACACLCSSDGAIEEVYKAALG